MSVGAASAGASVTVTEEHDPLQSLSQALLDTAELEQGTTEWNGMLIADALMTSVLTTESVAEEMDEFLQALYAAHFSGDAVVGAETVAVVEGANGERFLVPLERTKKVKGLRVLRLAILCRTRQGRVFLHTERHSEKDTLSGFEPVPLQGDGTEHVDAHVMHVAQIDTALSFDDPQDEYDEETISDLQAYVDQATDLVAHEGVQVVVFAGKILFKATTVGASIAGTVASAVAWGALGMAIGAMQLASEPVTVVPSEPESSDSLTYEVGETRVTRKRNSPLVELIRSAEAFTDTNLVDDFPEGQRVGQVIAPGVMRAETVTYRAGRKNVSVDPRLWRSLHWIDLGDADIYRPFRKYFEERIGEGAIVKLDRNEFEQIMKKAVENPTRGFFGSSDPIEKYAAKEIDDVLGRLLDKLGANAVLTVDKRVYAPNPYDPYAYLLQEFHDMLRFTLGFTTRRLESAFNLLKYVHRYEHDPTKRVEDGEDIEKNAPPHPLFRTTEDQDQVLGKEFKDKKMWALLERLKVPLDAHVWGRGRSLRYKGTPEYVVEDTIRIRSSRHLADFETWRDVTPDHVFVTLPDRRLSKGVKRVKANSPRERLIENMLSANNHAQVPSDGMPTDLSAKTVVAVTHDVAVRRAMKGSQDASGTERVQERPQPEKATLYYAPYAPVERQEDYIVNAVREFLLTYFGFTTQEFEEAVSEALHIRRSAQHLLPVRLHPNFMLPGRRVGNGANRNYLDKLDPRHLGERPGRLGAIGRAAQGGISAVRAAATKVGQVYANTRENATETHRYDELHVLGLKPDAGEEDLRPFSGVGTRVDEARVGQEEAIMDRFLTRVGSERTTREPRRAPSVPRTRRGIDLIKFDTRNRAAAAETSNRNADNADKVRQVLELRARLQDSIGRKQSSSLWPAEALVRLLTRENYVLFQNAVYYAREGGDHSLFAGEVPGGGVDYTCALDRHAKAYACISKKKSVVPPPLAPKITTDP